MKSLRFVFAYARNYIGPLTLATTTMIALVGVQLLTPWIVRELIAAVQRQATAGPAAADGTSTAYVTRLALLLLLVFGARAGLRFANNYASHIAGWGVVADCRRQIYEHLQRLTLRFYEDQQTGQLMSRMVNDSDRFEMLIAHAIPGIFVNVLTLIGVGAMLFSMSWQLMLLTMIPMPLIIVAMRSFAKYVRPAFRKRQRQLAELNATLADNLSGIREIKAFTREEIEAARIGQHIERYRTSLLAALKLLAIFEPSVELISSLGTVIVIYFGGRLAFQQTLPIADLVAFFLYLDLFYQPVRALSGTWEQIQEALASADRVGELLNEQPEIASRPGAIELVGRARGDLSLRDVSFAYIEGVPVLEHINLDIPAGSVVALVGPTGVGKTTLASLIPRFYDPTEAPYCLTAMTCAT